MDPIAESAQHRVVRMIVIIIGALLVLFVVFFAWGHRALILRSLESNMHVVNVPGKIYLSLAPDNGSAPSGIYTYTFASGSLGRVLADISTQVPAYDINTSSTISANGAILTFVRKKNTESVQQVYVAAPDGAGSRKVTNTAERFKRDPVLSPSGDYLAFDASSVVRDGSEVDGVPGDWAVYLADLSGNAWRIATGTNPLFSPDEKKLLVLQNDGFHLVDISNVEKPNDIGKVLSPMGASSAYVWAKANLSKDGTRLAWVVPKAGRVFTARINSWNTFSITPDETIVANAYGAVFSPDGGQLALEEVRPSIRPGSTHVVVSVYDLSSGTARDAIDLYEYKNAYVRLGGWTE